MTLEIKDKLQSYDTSYKPFITKWLLTDDLTITLPINTSSFYKYDFSIDWGDGTTASVTAYNDPDISHTYSTSGIKTVVITGLLEWWRFNNTGDKLKITDIIKTGYTGMVTLADSFRGCSNLKYIENDSEWTRNVDTMTNTFLDCISLDCEISNWDVSNVIYFNLAFYGCTNFNPSSITWKIGNTNSLQNMFRLCTNFNSDINSFDTSSCEDMFCLFWNSNFDKNIGSWDVSNVVDIGYMFANTPFNQDITNWDVSSVGQNIGSMIHMFDGASSFDQDISKWNFTSFESSASLSFQNMLDNSGLSPTNYDKLLIKFDNTGLEALNLGAANITRTATSATAFSNLIGKGWTITDAGQV